MFCGRGGRTAAACLRSGALACLLVLSGCGTVSSVFGGSSGTPAACPSAVILQPLRNTAVFGTGGGRRPADVAFYGVLDEVDSSCERSGDNLRVKLNVVVIAQRGPTARGDSVDFNYFVAVIGPDESIISKKPFQVDVKFGQAGIRAGVTDHIEETIPLAGRNPKELTIDLGFQQSPEVVEFYRHYRGR